MSVGSWLIDLVKTAVADAVLRRPIDLKVRRGGDGKVDVDVRMSPSNERPQQNVYYGYAPPQPGYPPGYYPPQQQQYARPAPPPPASPGGQPQSQPAEGQFQMPRSFDA